LPFSHLEIKFKAGETSNSPKAMKPINTWLASASFDSLFWQPVFGAIELPKVDLGYEVHQAISFNVRLLYPYAVHLFLTLRLVVQPGV
jgi:hypothetical protein